MSPESIVLFCFVILVSEVNSGKPVKRPDGSWFYPGRGCGVGQKYIYLDRLPADTSNLKCAFYKPNSQPLVPKRPEIDYDRCYLEGNWGDGTQPSQFSYVDNVETPFDCQELCRKEAQCNIFNWRDYKRCHLRTDPSPIYIEGEGAKISGPKYCPIETFWVGNYPKKFYLVP